MGRREVFGMKGREMMGGEGMAGKGMAGMKTPAALPAFPGASHIYHIGSTGFFLDDPQRIKLTTEQQTALSQAKEKSLLEQASFQRKIDDAEQELGTLTSSDKPDVTKIDAKVRAPVHDYEPGTWGPPEAEELTAGICGCDSPVWLLPDGRDGESRPGEPELCSREVRIS